MEFGMTIEKLINFFKRSNEDKLPDTSREFLFGAPDLGQCRSSSAIRAAMGRPFADYLKACEMRDCWRPSHYNVVTIKTLDIDNPARWRKPQIKEEKLPFYKWYTLCDRCFDREMKEGLHPIIIEGGQLAGLEQYQTSMEKQHG
jgi:hypothetical protein